MCIVCELEEYKGMRVLDCSLCKQVTVISSLCNLIQSLYETMSTDQQKEEKLQIPVLNTYPTLPDRMWDIAKQQMLKTNDPCIVVSIKYGVDCNPLWTHILYRCGETTFKKVVTNHSKATHKEVGFVE